jgi:hypothetical protein
MLFLILEHGAFQVETKSMREVAFMHKINIEYKSLLVIALPVIASFFSLFIVPELFCDWLKLSVFYTFLIVLPGIYFASILLKDSTFGVHFTFQNTTNMLK